MDSGDPYQTLASLANSQILQQHELAPHVPQTHTQQQQSESGKRKSGEDGQPQQRAKRNRYISIACNECKRRKIKCNGQVPCQRCGNLNLECVYTPNCCNGFKDSQEYREMARHIASLQEQVNTLYHDLSSLRTQLGHPPPPPLQHFQQSVPPPPAPVQQALVQQVQQQQNAAIDPSLQSQSYYPSHSPSFSGAQASLGAPTAPTSPSATRARSQSQSQQSSFRGPTSAKFNFDVAKSSLQTMGITGQDGTEDASGDATASSSPNGSPPARSRMQVLQSYHADKDPIWQISQEEAIRLCESYEDEMSLMHPVLDINRVIGYARKLYCFTEAAHRTGLMQQGLPGADAIEDEDTNILKMVLATALVTEASGRSDLGRRLFQYVQPAIEALTLGNAGINGIRLLAMAAVYSFHEDNEGHSWRLIGHTARLCIELGLHRRETYDAMQDENERWEMILLFWSIYVLDRRWSFGTGMPFALQDGDIDPNLPKPEDRSPYLSAMIQYSAIGSKVWRTAAATSSAADGNIINTEEMSYLDYQVTEWHRRIPPSMRFEHHTQQGGLTTPIGPASSRAGNRLRVLLYLRANHMRIMIYRPVLHFATSIVQHREQAQIVVDVAKDTISVLTHINQTSDLYRSQQMLFNSFLTSALAVLFLAVSHTPGLFAETVREEFYMALDLVRGFSKGSWIGRRLWKTIRVLKEIGPKLGLPITEINTTHESQHQQQDPKDPESGSRSAALAMAGLAGHNVDEMAPYNGNPGRHYQWSTASGSSSSPDGMADDLTNLFEAAGGLQTMGNSGMNGDGSFGADGQFGGTEEELSNILQPLF